VSPAEMERRGIKARKVIEVIRERMARRANKVIKAKKVIRERKVIKARPDQREVSAIISAR
jgi:hypothetical protein